MTLPPWIEFNGQRVEFAACNVYQQVIYKSLVSELNKANSLTNEREKSKQEGVIDYLAERLFIYGALTNIQNAYASLANE